MKKIIKVYDCELFSVDTEKIQIDVVAGSEKIIFFGIKNNLNDEIKFFITGVPSGKESCVVVSDIARNLGIGKWVSCGNHNRCRRFEVASVCGRFCIDNSNSPAPEIYVFGDVALSPEYTGMLCYPARYIKDESFHSTEIEFHEARQQVEEIVSSLGYSFIHEEWMVGKGERNWSLKFSKI